MTRAFKHSELAIWRDHCPGVMRGWFKGKVNFIDEGLLKK